VAKTIDLTKKYKTKCGHEVSSLKYKTIEIKGVEQPLLNSETLSKIILGKIHGIGMPDLSGHINAFVDASWDEFGTCLSYNGTLSENIASDVNNLNLVEIEGYYEASPAIEPMFYDNDLEWFHMFS
jgi:hypothetical protein